VDKCQNCYQMEMFQMIIYYDQILKITGSLNEKTLRGVKKITGTFINTIYTSNMNVF
jgi:hypothetical protein